MGFFLKYGVDIILAVIFISSVVEYSRRGFVRAILSLAAVFVSIFLAIQLSDSLATWSYNNLVSKIVVNRVEEAMPQGFDSASATEIVKETADALPDYLVKQLKTLGIDVEKITEDIKKEDLSDKSTAEEISERIIKPAAVVLLKMLCYILIFLVSRGILEFFIGLINRIVTLPVLKTANKWLGAALGAVKGVIIVLVLCTVLNALLGVTKGTTFGTAVDNSKITGVVGDIKIGDYEITEPLTNSK